MKLDQIERAQQLSEDRKRLNNDIEYLTEMASDETRQIDIRIRDGYLGTYWKTPMTSLLFELAIIEMQKRLIEVEKEILKL